MERRALPRRSVAISGQTHDKRGSFPCLIRTLNEKGLGFDSGEHFQVGDEVALAWAFGPRESALQVHCVVRNAEGTQVGVEFLNLPLADRMRISHFLMTTAASPSR